MFYYGGNGIQRNFTLHFSFKSCMSSFMAGKMPHGSVNVSNFVTFCGDSIVTPSGIQNSSPVLKCQV